MLSLLTKNRASGFEHLYAEASASVRHYSSLLLTTKVATIAQGLTLLAGQGYLLENEDCILSALGALFELFFTLVLYFIGRNFMDHFNSMVKVAQKIEKHLASNTPHGGSMDRIRRDKFAS